LPVSNLRSRLALALLAATFAVSPASAAGASSSPDIAPFLAAHRTEYLEAMRRARAWLDALHVDPTELRSKGIKGKKKLVEQLEAYYRLWRVASGEEKPQLLARVKSVAAVTYQDRYHDMGSISDEWFKQDATSYLRGALLMERMGLDTKRYRQEIGKIQPRLDRQMSQRGPNQQQTFHWYYQFFGLKEPFPLGDALKRGIIASRADPSTLSNSQVYDLTHEVYAKYEFGDRVDIDPFPAADKAYLDSTLATLATRYIERHDPDLMAEVVDCLHDLRFSKEPGYRAGISFLLARQNQDGSWGTYASQRRVMGDYVRQGFQLHTTMVAILALTAAFDEPLPPRDP